MNRVEYSVWRKSQRCMTGACVEVGLGAADVVGLRDSKQKVMGDAQPIVHLRLSQWHSFSTNLKDQRLVEQDGFEVQEFVDGGVKVSAGDVTLCFSADEWAAFIAGVVHGEFDFAISRPVPDRNRGE